MERRIMLVGVWHELALRRIKLIEDIEIFIKWYYGDRKEKCPYSKESLIRLADDILVGFSTADSDFIEKHRNDYEVLEMVCRNGFMSSLDLVEIIKLMDHFAGENSEVMDCAEKVLDRYEEHYKKEAE